MGDASVDEFKAQVCRMPGDREQVAAVGQYVIELYYSPMNEQPRAVIEVTERTTGGKYLNAGSIWFNTRDAERRQFDDPEAAAKDAFDRLAASSEAVIEAILPSNHSK